MYKIGTISQQELEELVKESREIADSMSAYLKFLSERSAILKAFMPTEGQN